MDQRDAPELEDQAVLKYKDGSNIARELEDGHRSSSWNILSGRSSRTMKPIPDKARRTNGRAKSMYSATSAALSTTLSHIHDISDSTRTDSTRINAIKDTILDGVATWLQDKPGASIASPVDRTTQDSIPHRVEYLEQCGPECFLSHAPKLAAFRPKFHTTLSHRKPLPGATLSTPDLYPPLTDWQTRILTIRSGSFHDPLDTALSSCDLLATRGVGLAGGSLRVEYDALSYCWGSLPATSRIHCNGMLFPVTEHLEAALRKLRQPKGDRYLWVDAICINQLDLVERAMQVRNMLMIYKKAREVIVWLGEEAEATKWSVNSLHSLRVSNNSPDVTLQAGVAICHDHSLLMSEGLLDIFHRPWFRRVWVQQESWAAGDSLIFLCGTVELTHGQLYITARIADLLSTGPADASVHSLPSSSGPSTRSFSDIPSADVETRFQIEREQDLHRDEPTSIEKSKKMFRDGDILEVVCHANGRECSDPRDHVYGLLGMSTTSMHSGREGSQSPNTLEIDYTITPAHVFVNLAWYIIKRDGWLSTFYLLQPTDQITKVGDEELPSWCPDWRFLEVPEAFLDHKFFEGLRSYSSFHIHRRLHSASRLSNLQVDSSGEALPWNVLRLRGLCVGNDMTHKSIVKVRFPSEVKAQMTWLTAMNLYVDLVAPKQARFGDSFVLFEDEPRPVCIRQTLETPNRWYFVGTCVSKMVIQVKHHNAWQALSGIARDTGSLETYDLV